MLVKRLLGGIFWREFSRSAAAQHTTTTRRWWGGATIAGSPLFEHFGHGCPCASIRNFRVFVTVLRRIHSELVTSQIVFGLDRKEQVGHPQPTRGSVDLISDDQPPRSTKTFCPGAGGGGGDAAASAADRSPRRLDSKRRLVGRSGAAASSTTTTKSGHRWRRISGRGGGFRYDDTRATKLSGDSKY